eukprot:TRINITY_DN1225_c0_g1_i1.p1 TRINITY_DN1225_c0_g1~~TRINITY_DN1225_c0_g1_i1.p1  ORF type:complete len:448 (-),score=55.88 TRINITY_DN1225_c0_g1_i1:62-1213(-)
MTNLTFDPMFEVVQEQIPIPNNSVHIPVTSFMNTSQSMSSTPPHHDGQVNRSCELCRHSHKKCERLTPEMPACHSCQKKAIPCVFTKSLPPGRKPKSSSSSTKRARRGDHYADHTADSRSVSSDQSSSSSGKIVQDHREVVRKLQGHQFLSNELNTQSALWNEKYYAHCIDNALSFWKFCGFKAQCTKSEFIRKMLDYQQLQPENNYRFEEEDLEKLVWLTGLDKRPDLAFLAPCFQEHHVGLIFLWLGPAILQDYVPAFTAVRRIFDIVNSDFAVRSRFKGFFSRAAACFELRRNPSPRADDCIYRLNEGRLTLISQQECDVAEVYSRSLVKTSYPPFVFEQGYPTSVAQLSDDDFVHELVFTAKQAPAAAAHPIRRCGRYL